MREFLINENDSGQRLDRFITKLMPRLPKSMLYKGLRKNCVKLNGRHVKDGAVFLNEGDTLALYFKDEFFEPERGFVYVEPRLDIVFEDSNIIIINKAPGTVVHADDRGTAATLVDMVKSYLYKNGGYDPAGENSFSPALCNRLDRNTGGLVIAAKNAAALRCMNKLIRERRVRKYYMAIAEGYPESRGHLEGMAERGGRVTRIKGSAAPGAKAVSLDYRTLKKKDGYSLLEIELHTGRTHQIRAQLSAAGYPLAGDTKYGAGSGRYRQALWSVRLEFDSLEPESPLGYLGGRSFSVEAPFEKEFTDGIYIT
ncbi:MAG: RluA family pseudouridine synthase [Clostridia bacterium]|nr:RluA family pseudouridine synthase [Clostridia bacterium]